MQELWQLYNEDGNPIAGRGATKEEVLSNGLLHGAAHVWIWRKTVNGREVLLQKRAANKRTFPNMLDISAAGHIDLGETLEDAAAREAHEELGLSINILDLRFIGKFHINLKANRNSIENEFRWVYSLEIKADKEFKLQESEVASTQWINLDTFKQSVLPNNGGYVPQGDDYFHAVVTALSA